MSIVRYLMIFLLALFALQSAWAQDDNGKTSKESVCRTLYDTYMSGEAARLTLQQDRTRKIALLNDLLQISPPPHTNIARVRTEIADLETSIEVLKAESEEVLREAQIRSTIERSSGAAVVKEGEYPREFSGCFVPPPPPRVSPSMITALRYATTGSAGIVHEVLTAFQEGRRTLLVPNAPNDGVLTMSPLRVPDTFDAKTLEDTGTWIKIAEYNIRVLSLR